MNVLETMKQALEAIEKARFYDNDDYDYYTGVILNLEDAIAEMEKAEPVAWQLWKDGEFYAIKYAKEDRGARYTWVPLYTAPAVPEDK